MTLSDWNFGKKKSGIMKRSYGKQGITCKHGRNKSDDLWQWFEYYKTIWKVSM